MKQYFFTLFLAVILFSCQESTTKEEKLPQQPNIIFIMTDDHAYQAISAYGSDRIQTPNIDRLANNGMRFDRAFVTNSICAPSRAVILTGKHSHLNGVLDNRLRFDSTQTTFPKLLQQVGYQTAMIGKWHLKSEPTGFNYWKVLPGQGNYYNPDWRTPNGIVRDTGYVTDIITDEAINWLASGRDTEKPFLLIYQHKAPHRVWIDMQGKSLMPLLKGQQVAWRDALYYHYYEYPGAHSVKRHYGVRTDRYKLIHFYNDIDEWEMYDLEKDPREMQSVYDDTDYAEVRAQLHQRLNELQEEYRDPIELEIKR